MNTFAPDDIETRLRELFDRQAAALPVSEAPWDGAPIAAVTELTTMRRARPARAAIIATAAAVLLVIGIVAVSPRRGVFVAGRAGAPAPVNFSTKQVSLRADDMTIDAGGHRFTAGGSAVDVHSDPGTVDKYQTIELTWTESGIEMRLNIYFTSDGHDWWANGIRTYNGRSNGEWIDYPGNYFRTPLGRAFTAVHFNVSSGGGRLQFTNLHLQPFLPPAACKNATTQYVFGIGYDQVHMPNVTTDGFGLGTPTLLDTRTCTPVPNPEAFVYTLALTPAGVAGIEVGNGRLVNARHVHATDSIQLAPEAAGSATLRVTATNVIGGRVAATVDIPVTVG